jgi:hypothetical protein
MINVFFHVATMGKYESIIKDTLTAIRDSLLYQNAHITICYNGTGNISLDGLDNIRVIQNTQNIAEGEFPTLHKIKQFSISHPNQKVLYIHTKGTSTDDNVCIDDWRNYMLHFNVTKWGDCIEQLKENDTCGVDLRTDPTLHYSGNFWWANTNYIKTLPEFHQMPVILSERHKAEFWICYNRTSHKCLWDCGISSYQRHLHRYEKEKYAS